MLHNDDLKVKSEKKQEALIKEVHGGLHDFLLAVAASGEGATGFTRNRAISLIELERDVMKIIKKKETP